MDKQNGVLNICYGEQIYAIIVYSYYEANGIHFFTEDSYSQQIAYMHHSEGKLIDAHTHNYARRDVYYTQEVLVIRRGKLRVDFYHQDRSYYRSVLLEAGDIILLIAGGHGFKVIEEVEMIEIKQGPYLGEQDKTRFDGVKDEDVKWLKK